MKGETKNFFFFFFFPKYFSPHPMASHGSLLGYRTTTLAEIGMICTRPGCDQPGPSLCASCRLVGYCCRTCQVEDWLRHKETDCQGHLRKIGMSHLQKAI